MANKKDKLKEEHGSTDFEVFGWRVFFIYTSNVKETREALSHKVGALETSLENCPALHSYNAKLNDSFVIFNNTATIGDLAHECFHVLWRMFISHGVELDNETTAYHLGFLVDKIVDFKKKFDNKMK